MADQTRRAMLTAASYANDADDLRQLLNVLGLYGQDDAPTQRDDCGTVAGYRRHKSIKERPCWPCRNANNAYQREQRAIAKRAEGRS